MKIQLYKNLNRGDWSIRFKGKVIAHEQEAWLADVLFHVSQSGRKRVCERKCREVHAWATGELITSLHEVTRLTRLASRISRIEITYNPYKASTFVVRSTGEPVLGCKYAHFGADGRAYAYMC